MNLWDNKSNDLLYLCFNQTYSCFAGATNNGFFAYNCEPFAETTRKEFSSGGIGIIEMCYRTNILALVGGGKCPRYPTNKVMMWDDTHSRCIGELSFPSDVKGVKLRRDTVVVILERHIYVYNFQDLKLIEQRKTISNPLGLCALCPHTNNKIMAFPGQEKGVINIDLFDIQRQVITRGHESELMALALNFDGSLVASASEKGTLIRVFSTTSGDMVHELRRGAERAIIYSIAFNSTSTYLACSSDKGTIHVFSLVEEENEGDANIPIQDTENSAEQSAIRTTFNPGRHVPNNTEDSYFTNAIGGLVRRVLPKYFKSHWSIAQYRVQESRSICAFGTQKNSLIIIGADGSFHKVIFDPTGARDCEKVNYFKFLAKSTNEIHQ